MDYNLNCNMITEVEKKELLARAYVPEHSFGLMTSVSAGEPFLIDDVFCIQKKEMVIVIGYPLQQGFNTDEFERVLRKIVDTFRPMYLSLVATELPASYVASCLERESDYYYALPLHGRTVRPGLRKAVAAAMEHVVVEQANSLGEAHRNLAQEFVDRVGPPPRVRELMFRMWDYVGHSEGSLVLNAWSTDKKLAAFYVMDMSPEQFSTYVIGCHSRQNCVRWASDLLFFEMIKVSEERAKKYIHLGLGVNAGIRRFKEKWGGKPILRYEMCELTVRKPSLLDAIAGYAKIR